MAIEWAIEGLGIKIRSTTDKPTPKTKTEIPAIDNQYKIDFFGKSIEFTPNAFQTLLLFIVLLIQIKSLADTSLFKIAQTLINRYDFELQDKIDDIAVELRQLTDCERVTIAFFHNGTSNHIFHYNKFTVMGESFKLGLAPIKDKLKQVQLTEVLTAKDFDFLTAQKKDFILVSKYHIDETSVKFRAFTHQFGIQCQVIKLLKDDVTNKSFGFVSLAYGDRRPDLPTTVEPKDLELSYFWPNKLKIDVEDSILGLHTLINEHLKKSVFRNTQKVKSFFNLIQSKLTHSGNNNF